MVKTPEKTYKPKDSKEISLNRVEKRFRTPLGGELYVKLLGNGAYTYIFSIRSEGEILKKWRWEKHIKGHEFDTNPHLHIHHFGKKKRTEHMTPKKVLNYIKKNLDNSINVEVFEKIIEAGKEKNDIP